MTYSVSDLPPGEYVLGIVVLPKNNALPNATCFRTVSLSYRVTNPDGRCILRDSFKLFDICGYNHFSGHTPDTLRPLVLEAHGVRGWLLDDGNYPLIDRRDASYTLTFRPDDYQPSHVIDRRFADSHFEIAQNGACTVHVKLHDPSSGLADWPALLTITRYGP
jgi:hypothetical protein